MQYALNPIHGDFSSFCLITQQQDVVLFVCWVVVWSFRVGVCRTFPPRHRVKIRPITLEEFFSQDQSAPPKSHFADHKEYPKEHQFGARPPRQERDQKQRCVQHKRRRDHRPRKLLLSRERACVWRHLDGYAERGVFVEGDLRNFGFFAHAMVYPRFVSFARKDKLPSPPCPKDKCTLVLGNIFRESFLAYETDKSQSPVFLGHSADNGYANDGCGATSFRFRVRWGVGRSTIRY